eukprot:GFUD01022463.1.p1 GENE.GFUD01022463.1~~GFUD01022463.1.p1  ORF type:complete len:436 (-),score=97.54 GFUD01022463.1:146-1453(-)
MSIYNTLCRNGPGCHFLAMGRCWFRHLNEVDDKMVELFELLARLPERIDRLQGIISKHQKEKDKQRRLVLNKPVHQELKCTHESISNDVTDLLINVSQLPPELHLAILHHFDLETVLGLDLPYNLLHKVLQLPRGEKLGSWLGRQLLEQDLGIIYVPGESKMLLANYEDGDEDYDEDEDREDGNSLKVSDISPGLAPGAYKVRILENGFDLVRVGRDFLSTQCGPVTCFPTTENKDWAGSFMSRGFSLQTETRSDLAPGNWGPEHSWRLSLGQALADKLSGTVDQLRAPVFVISLQEEWWTQPWSHRRGKNYSVDSVAHDYLKDRDNEELLGLGMVTNMQGEVVAYTISGGPVFAAYDPADDPHSDEGWYDFSVSRYQYTGQAETIGLIITGSQNDYGMPWLLEQEEEEFPDQEHYTGKQYLKPSIEPTSSCTME